MSNLSIAPTKLNFFSKNLERKVEGLGEELSLRRMPRHSISVRGPKNKRAHCPSQTKRRTKGKIQPKRTRKALSAVSKPQKGIGDLLNRPSSGGQCRLENAVQPEDNLVDSASEVEIPQREASQPKDNGGIGKTDTSEGGPDAASDPISDFLTQGKGSGGSPPRERKQTFAQAELEEPSTSPKITEDDLRRMEGPPRAYTEVSIAQPVGTVAQTTGNQFQSHPGGPTVGDRGDNRSMTNDELGLPPVTISGISEVGREGQVKLLPSASGTPCCRALPGRTAGTTNQVVSEKDTSTGAPSIGRYGVISLFDGVSSVVPIILKKKLGYPPVAAILAECDRSLRELVCTEFGYRSDEKWGYTQDGMAVLYLRDVNAVINGNCKVLQELVQMFPDCKWFIIGGSPCQDLTFAGPLRGLLGLIGPSSRLFFVLLCVIYTMQQLVGPAAVRYLVENAASMLQIHLDAFCRLLGLPPDQHGRYVWDPCDFGFQITRRRNYFRNFDDIEDSEFPTQVFGQEFGPLIDQYGNNIPFAPLLRTRETLPYGMIRSSWTLYQPHALVWNYAFWNGRTNFGKECRLGPNKIPHLKWEQINHSTPIFEGLVSVPASLRESQHSRERHG